MGIKGVTVKMCKAPHCEGGHYAKGYCKKHYTQVTKHGDLMPERERGVPRVCKVPGCGRKDTIRFYCRKHARQMKRYGRLTPEREHVMGRTGCKVPGCPDPHRAHGLCARHYNKDRWKRVSQGAPTPKRTKKKIASKK
jgi:hypothetical protein